jgi:hypothetical protein
VRATRRPVPRRDAGRFNKRAAVAAADAKAAGSSPETAHKTKAKRALHRMAFAGTVPLLARIPSPVTKPRTGRNVPADAGVPLPNSHLRRRCPVNLGSNVGYDLAQP